MKMPKPTKFHKKLAAALVGDWSGDEIMHPGPMDPKGGKSKGRYRSRLATSGFTVVQDYEQTVGGKVTFEGHGVFTYDVNENCYLWYWFDSMGFVPCTTTKGQFVGNSIVWTNQSPMGHARYTHTFLRGGKCAFKIECSEDGQQWAPMMDGLYTKKATKKVAAKKTARK